MHPTPSVLLATLLACAPALAQTVFSPQQAYASQEGNGLGQYFGAFAKARAQLADGSLRSQAITIKSIAYRADYTDHYPGTGIGRTWTQVTLDMSEFDMANMVPDPSANITSTQTRVFSAPVTWPTLSGLPPTRPDVLWGPRFPFTRSWVYSGKLDILCDYRFDGGALANKFPWTRLGGDSYHLDSYYYGVSYFGAAVQVGRWGNPNACGDSGNFNPNDAAFTALDIYHYGPNHPTAKNQVLIQTWGIYLGANTPCITAIGAGLVRQGVTIPGLSCQKLYVDLGKPALMLFNKTTNGTGYGSIPTVYLTGNALPHTMPVVPAWIDLLLVAQSAWNDTVSGKLKLTAATVSWIPPMTPWQAQTQVPRKAVYEYYAGISTTPLRLGPSQQYYMNNICAYGR